MSPSLTTLSNGDIAATWQASNSAQNQEAVFGYIFEGGSGGGSGSGGNGTSSGSPESSDHTTAIALGTVGTFIIAGALAVWSWKTGKLAGCCKGEATGDHYDAL